MPWIRCQFRQKTGKFEYHTLLINHDGWVPVVSRKPPSHIMKGAPAIAHGLASALGRSESCWRRFSRKLMAKQIQKDLGTLRRMRDRLAQLDHEHDDVSRHISTRGSLVSLRVRRELKRVRVT
jgi:hypothetical protein